MKSKSSPLSLGIKPHNNLIPAFFYSQYSGANQSARCPCTCMTLVCMFSRLPFLVFLTLLISPPVQTICTQLKCHCFHNKLCTNTMLLWVERLAQRTAMWKWKVLIFFPSKSIVLFLLFYRTNRHIIYTSGFLCSDVFLTQYLSAPYTMSLISFTKLPWSCFLQSEEISEFPRTIFMADSPYNLYYALFMW